MSQVKYTGSSDFQIFEKKDFEKAGVDDQGKVTFARGEPTEVTESAAQALTSTDRDESIFYAHSFVEVDEEGNEVKQSSAKGGSNEGDEPDLGDADSRGDQTDTDTAGAGAGTTGGGTTTRRSTAKKAAAGNRSSTRSS